MAISLNSMSIIVRERTGGGRRGKRLHRFSGDDGPRCAKRPLKVMWLHLQHDGCNCCWGLQEPAANCAMALVKVSRYY